MPDEQMRIVQKYGMSRLEAHMIANRDVVWEARPLMPKPEGSDAARLVIVCARTGQRARWNDAARTGWTTGEKPYTYESPKEDECK